MSYQEISVREGGEDVKVARDYALRGTTGDLHSASLARGLDPEITQGEMTDEPHTDQQEGSGYSTQER